MCNTSSVSWLFVLQVCFSRATASSMNRCSFAYRLETNSKHNQVLRSHDSASTYVQHSLDSSSAYVQRSHDVAYVQHGHDFASTYVQHSHASRSSSVDAAIEAMAHSRRLGTASTESLALPEESVSPFFGSRPAPAGYQGRLPVFSMPPDFAAPSHNAVYSPAAAQPVRASSGPEAAVPFPGMVGPGWDAGDAAGGPPKFIPSSRGAQAAAYSPLLAASPGSISSTGSCSSAKPSSLGLGAFGLGGGLWGAPPQESSTAEDTWASALNAKAGQEADRYGGIGKAALSKLWE